MGWIENVAQGNVQDAVNDAVQRYGEISTEEVLRWLNELVDAVAVGDEVKAEDLFETLDPFFSGEDLAAQLVYRAMLRQEESKIARCVQFVARRGLVADRELLLQGMRPTQAIVTEVSTLATYPPCHQGGGDGDASRVDEADATEWSGVGAGAGGRCAA